MRIRSHIKQSFLAAGVLGLCLPAGAGLIYDNFTTGRWTVNEGVPDYNANNPQGLQDSQTVSVSGTWQVTDVRVSVNISGGYNGDLYGYLRHDDGVKPVGFIVLLNRPGYSGTGYGYGNSGFGLADGGTPFVFSDGGSYSGGVENYQSGSPQYNTASGQLTGTWKPDAGSVSFATRFSGLDPNGTWTLFFQDLATGDQSTLVNWGLQIEAVPEPVNVALGLFGVVFAGATAIRWRLKRKSSSG